MAVDRQARIREINNKIQEVKDIALAKYGIDLSAMPVLYNLRGRTTAGQARMKNWQVSIRLNSDMLMSPDEKVYRDMVDDTIPHEIAHILCYKNRQLGWGHDQGWKDVCRALGGNGKRTHDISDQPLAKGLTYMYTGSNGKRMSFSEKRHLKIQNGGWFRMRPKHGGDRFDKYCGYTIQSGHTVLREVAAQPRPTTTSLQVKIVNSTPTPEQKADGVIGVMDFFNIRRAVLPQRNNAGGSKADQVRSFIREAKMNNLSVEYVIGRTIRELGMARGQAKTYVTGNWHKA